MARLDTSSAERCPSCGGSGQLSSFKGESRFLLTVEECPFCDGLGYVLPPDDDRGTAAVAGQGQRLAQGQAVCNYPARSPQDVVLLDSYDGLRLRFSF